MSKKNQIVDILGHTDRPLTVGEIANIAGVSRVYASKTLNSFLRLGILENKKVGAKVYYSMSDSVVLLNNTFDAYSLKEDEILALVRKDRRFMDNIDEAARSAFEFAFPEMLNNAIEHSRSAKIEVTVRTIHGNLEFTIRDFGIGVFRNVQQEKRLASEYDAVRELLKGKSTTAPRAHSGMGIFFTSKIADKFLLSSYDLSLLVDNTVADTFVDTIEPELIGTKVEFTIDTHTKKSVATIFRNFSIDPEEGDFGKTYILVRLYRLGTIYVSRSQARALLVGLEKFKEVTLDFEGVDNVGQAFADEIFRVYALHHPEVQIKYVNANKNVEFMIKMALDELKTSR